jgi:hypothetical protein
MNSKKETYRLLNEIHIRILGLQVIAQTEKKTFGDPEPTLKTCITVDRVVIQIVSHQSVVAKEVVLVFFWDPSNDWRLFHSFLVQIVQKKVHQAVFILLCFFVNIHEELKMSPE